MFAVGALDSGRYQLGRLLGRGGLGEVYLAHDRTLNRDVAIKFVTPERLADPAARHALLREARAAAALDHPYICTVHEVGETADGRGFIVMQYVEGVPLSTVLESGPMPVRAALGLCADVAQALAVAHRGGVVHRDLKPGNIIIGAGGRPKLVDFGIAKVLLPDAILADAETETNSSTVHALVGTPAYMSPEQIQHRPVDGRSDLFSLGLVLFECLTGRRAFEGATSVETMAGILHGQPPPPSTLRVELSEAHDELCRRLIAKEPGDRFQSADEVIGAIGVLQPEASATRGPAAGQLSPRRRVHAAIWAVATLALAGVSAGTWRWTHPAAPSVPDASDLWYRHGTEAIREGAYDSAHKALDQAVAIFPGHALAYARLAEVETELDDPQAAERHLLKVSALVPNESRLPGTERLRLRAVRALVLRDVDTSIAAYGELASLAGAGAGALVDLGRAQEAAGLRTQARGSYEQAVRRDSQYAAAYLRLGHVQALEAHRSEALAAFDEAERLYTAASDTEGQTEVVLQRGIALDAFGDLRRARHDLERAAALAESRTPKSIFQDIRARLALSSVTASEGNYKESQRIALAAVSEAERNGLEAVAAGGLIDLAATFLFADEKAQASDSAQRALQLALRRGAPLAVARAKTQLAEVYFRTDRPRDALQAIADVLPFLKANRYRRLELTAQSIAARTEESLGHFDVARTLSAEVLRMADLLHDDAQAAIAAATLAGILTSLGRYPDALQLRVRAEEIHRRQADIAALPYDLANRADLLIRLGRGADAGALLAEIDAGIAKRVESYVGRARRVAFLRAFEAATRLRCDTALPLLERVTRQRATDSAARLAPSVLAFCDARAGRSPRPIEEPPLGSADPATLRERQYWRAAAALQRGDGRMALAEATGGLQLVEGVSNDELTWRLAAVAATAARRLGDPVAPAMSTLAHERYDRLRSEYKQDFTSYERRADLSELRKKELQ
jgi:tetratricopeptide (TPR) repeat protein/predicted Ser/Thr protein kinase